MFAKNPKKLDFLKFKLNKTSGFEQFEKATWIFEQKLLKNLNFFTFFMC